MYLAAAILGSLLLNTSVIFQAHDARNAPAALSLHPGLIWFLMRRWMWILGTVETIASALLQIYAMRGLSVAVVQSISTAGILVLPVHARAFERQRLVIGEIAAVVAIAFCVVMASVTIPEQTGALSFTPWPLFTGALAATAGAFVAARRWRSGLAMSLVAGIGFGVCTLLQKVLALSLDSRTAEGISIALLGACGAIGFLAQMSALQIAPPVRVAPAILAVSAALPIFAAPFVFGEEWPHAVATGVTLAAAIAASAYIARTAQLRPEPSRVGAIDQAGGFSSRAPPI